MKTIPLTQGKVARVDDVDYERIAAFRWCVHAEGARRYAVRADRIDGRKFEVRMHRFVLDAPHGLHVDHIDGDGLNNQRANLRLATNAENMRNQRRRSDNTSGYKGVSWKSERRRWVAAIVVDGRRIHLGYFDAPAEAHVAYCAASAKYHGAFGRVA